MVPGTRGPPRTERMSSVKRHTRHPAPQRPIFTCSRSSLTQMRLGIQLVTASSIDSQETRAPHSLSNRRSIQFRQVPGWFGEQVQNARAYGAAKIGDSLGTGLRRQYCRDTQQREEEWRKRGQHCWLPGGSRQSGSDHEQIPSLTRRLVVSGLKLAQDRSRPRNDPRQSLLVHVQETFENQPVTAPEKPAQGAPPL